MTATREDYQTIKEQYLTFIDSWKSGDCDALDNIFEKETACYLSTVAKYPCGSQHGLYGIHDFLTNHSTPDYFHITPCNYVSRLSGNKAQQSAVLVCHAGVIENGKVREIEFDLLNVNSWIKSDDEWKINEFRLDVCICTGDYKEFVENWYFEKEDLKYYFGIHLPVISGELDSPWARIPVEDDVKTEEEKIQEAFSQYAFGIDTLNFTLLTAALSDGLVVNMAPWGAMDKREFMQTLKFKRQASRYWSHPARLHTVTVNDNHAFLTLHRMAGHKQSALPVPVTVDNYDSVHADARYEIKMHKENNQWKVLRMDYFLGTIDLGKYA